MFGSGSYRCLWCSLGTIRTHRCFQKIGGLMQLTTGEASHCTSPHRTSYHTTKHHITPRHTTPLRRACCPQLIRLRASSPAMVEAPSNTRSASSGRWRPLAKMLVNTHQGWPSPPKRHSESQRTFVLFFSFSFSFLFTAHCRLTRLPCTLLFWRAPLALALSRLGLF